MDPSESAARNRLILRRTLSVVSWQYALWNAVLGLMKVQLGSPQGMWMLGHALLLAGAGFGLWRPRPWGPGAAVLATLGSFAWAGFDVQAGNLQAAMIDGAYGAVALAVFLGTRVRRLDNPAGGGDNPGR